MKRQLSLLFLPLLLFIVACAPRDAAPAAPSVTSIAPTETVGMTATGAATTQAQTTEVVPSATVALTDPSPTEAPAASATAPAGPTQAASATVPAAPPTATAVEGGTLAEPDRPVESILILEPGPGSRVTSPVRVRGESNPTFEQNLVVRIVSADGTELAIRPTTIQSDISQRGPFEIEIPFTVSGEENAFIQIFEQSARDGGITHLSSVGVMLAASGAENIVAVTPAPEQIAIFQPEQGAVISGGVVRVEGFGLAGFEQTLEAYIQDVDGNVIARRSITVQAPDMGLPGPFSVELPYTISGRMPARVAVRDVSPAFGGTVHLTSVNVTLDP